MNTMQEEFDAVVEHLFKQGRPSIRMIDNNKFCSYRGENGLSCAVGCRIPDEMYQPMMDACDLYDTNVSDLIKRPEYPLPPEVVAYTNLFERLQFTHDMCMTRNPDGAFILSDLERRLRGVASEFRLTYNHKG
jgi:hypothetical protein